MNANIKKALNILGIGVGTFFIEDIEIDYKYFTPTTLTNEITEEAIDGDINTDITTHIKKNKMEIKVSATLTSTLSIFNGGFKNKFDKLRELHLSGKVIKITGTDYDDKNWVIQSLTDNDEGINYIDIEVILKEVEFVAVKTFEYDSTVRGRAEYKPPQKKSKAEIKPKDFKEDKYEI